jgi:adenosylcobinamide-GDP ribazoletransferase
MRADLVLCLSFFSRVPLPGSWFPARPRALAEAATMVPVAGALIGLVPAAILLLGAAIKLSALVTAALAIAGLVLITGALHEDGLADCADGFGGGVAADQKLAIMRDSRLGTFGACALTLVLLLRIGTLAGLIGHAPAMAAGIVVSVAALSRTAALVPALLLRPARAEGLGARMGRPSGTIFIRTLLIAGLAAIPLLFLEPIRTMLALGLAALATLSIVHLAARQIGGQTGDVAGAVQQAVETSMLIGFSIGLAN